MKPSISGWRLAVLALPLLAHCAARGPAAPALPSGTVLATLPVGSGPTLLAISPDGARVYAAANRQLSVIDTSTNSIVATVQIDPYPSGIAVTPDGKRVFIASLFSIRLLVIDTATNTPSSSIDLTTERFRGGFGRMALSPDGQTAYVTNYANQVLAVIDTMGGRMNVLLMDMGARDIALTADGSQGYLAGCWSFCRPGSVERFDAVARRFGARFNVGAGPYRIALSPNGAIGYTANVTDSTLSIVDLATQQMMQSVRTPVEPTGLALSPDGATAYVLGQTDGNLALIDTRSYAVQTVAIGNRPREIVVTPDGRKLFVSTASSVIVLDAQAVTQAP